MLRSRSKAEILLQALPFLIMAAVAAAYLIVGPGLGITPLLSLGPAFGTLTGGVRRILILSATAFALCTALSDFEGQLATSRSIVAFATIGGVTVAAVIGTTQRLRRERVLTDVRAVADVAQRVLLRPVPRQIGRIRLAVRYISASAGARIGGDLYEVALVGDRLRLVIGDVQGKGLPAARVAATALGAFREAAHDAPGLPAIARRMEASLARLLTEEQFVTAVLAEVTGDGSVMQLLNCGHPPPLLLTATATRFADRPAASLPLGMAGLAGKRREVAAIALAPGDAVLFYTDGISEARNRDGAFYPLASRVPLGSTDPGRVLDYLRADVQRHAGHPLDDDAALLLLCTLR